jgi:hypothetical protein
MDVKALIHHKIGGKVPVVYVGAALFAAGGIYLYLKRKNTPPATTTTTTDTTGVDTTGGDLAAFGALGGSTSTGLAGAGGSIVTSPSEPVSDTNQAWSLRAIQYLIDKKLAPPGDAQSAIVAYLAGGDLTYDQGQLRDTAIIGVGLPPEPLGTIGSTGTPPALRQFTAFPGVHMVKGPNDNGYTAILNLYYGGRHDGFALLREANPSLGIGGPFPVGTKINVPAWTDPVYYTATSSTRTLAAIAAKNGISTQQLQELNLISFPVTAGTKVRVH